MGYSPAVETAGACGFLAFWSGASSWRRVAAGGPRWPAASGAPARPPRRDAVFATARRPAWPPSGQLVIWGTGAARRSPESGELHSSEPSGVDAHGFRMTATTDREVENTHHHGTHHHNSKTKVARRSISDGARRRTECASSSRLPACP